MNLNDFAKGAGAAALSAAVAYIGLNWGAVDIAEPWKSVIALAVLALWNRFRPGEFLLRYVRRISITR
ncbi:MAG: hypothetical protein ACT4PO_11655 [Actinomycetota bacterium]